MSSFSFSSSFVSFTLLFFIFMTSMVFGLRFEVGGEKGWVVPSGNETESYNEWAARQRFNIGDTLYFKFKNDSVLEVGGIDYKACNTSNPLVRYEKGNAVFQVERSGFYYFISDREDHCMAGQRLIVRVIHPTDNMGLSPGLVPTPSPSPSPLPSPETSPGGSGVSPSPEAPSGGNGSGDVGDSGGILGAASRGSTIKLDVSSFFVTAFWCYVCFFL